MFANKEEYMNRDLALSVYPLMNSLIAIEDESLALYFPISVKEASLH